jgi:hypothetical protein
MATTTASIDHPALDPHPAHRRGLALGVAAMLLIGGGAATAAVVARHDSSAPVEHTSASDPRLVAGTQTAGAADASPARLSSRANSARLRVQRINAAPQLSSREYSALLRAERVRPPR